jgi:Mg2+ and Co2+ transporter CorA
MNVILPLAHLEYAFLFIMGISVAVAAMVVLALWRKDWL